MIRRVFDPAIPNAFSADPDIAPQIGGPIDFAGAMNPANVFLFGENGGLIFEWKGPQTYETHIMVTRAGRGKWGFAAVEAAVQFMAGFGANHLWARIDPARPEVATLARRCGFTFACTHELDAGSGPVLWKIFNRRM